MDSATNRTSLGTSAALLASILFSAGQAQAENIFSVYTGTSWTRNSDLRISQPGAGTSMTIRDVEWGADPFKPAPYYGLRFTHFYDDYPRLGVALDFTHYKMYGKTERVSMVDGTWKGAGVAGAARMDQYVQRFEISHGVNVLSINGIYRYLDRNLAGGRLEPYAGLGLAYYHPHAENTVDNVPNESGYQSSGFGVQVLGGARYRLTDRVAVFLETKFNRGRAEVGIANGEAQTRIRTFHATAGVSYSF